MEPLILTLTNSNLTEELDLTTKDLAYREYFVQLISGGGIVKIKRKIGNNFAYLKISPTNLTDFTITESGAGYCLTNLARIGSIIFELSEFQENTEFKIIIST